VRVPRQGGRERASEGHGVFPLGPAPPRVMNLAVPSQWLGKGGIAQWHGKREAISRLPITGMYVDGLRGACALVRTRLIVYEQDIGLES
jgi:hypothetical protein